MEFLGNLGIDSKLLIAQMINFGLLLYLLKKLLYTPIIKRIEKDEALLKYGQIQQEKMKQQKIIFAKQKKQEITQAKKRAQEIIKEANGIAQKIKEKTYKESEKESFAIITQSKNKIQSLKTSIEKKIFRDLQTKISYSFQKSFKSALSTKSQKELQNVFWRDFILQINTIIFQKPKKSDFVKILSQSNLVGKNYKSQKNVLEKKLKERWIQKIGPLTLEYVYALTKKQEHELEKIIIKKIGFKINIIKKQNKNLINGFRFEIMGILIESNLLNIIHNATNIKL